MVTWLKSLFKRVRSEPDFAAKLLAQREASEQPWASFEVLGFEDDGRIALTFNWNKSFIKKIKELGFEAETEEDTVQLFFYTSSMRPTSLAADPTDDAVQSASHPSLSAINNELRVG